MKKNGKDIYEMTCRDCVQKEVKKVGSGYVFYVYFCRLLQDFIHQPNEWRAEIDVLDYPNYVIYRSCAYFEVREETLEKILKDYPDPYGKEVKDGEERIPKDRGCADE